jgi:hypothetical protein
VSKNPKTTVAKTWKNFKTTAAKTWENFKYFTSIQLKYNAPLRGK